MTPLSDLAGIKHFLRRGGVIAYVTESCFGLGCDPTNRRAVRRILRLKHRPQGKGLILIGSDVSQFRRFLAPLSDVLSARFPEWWPGPTSLLLPRSRHCPRWLTGRHEKLAVRVTAHPDAMRLCRALRMALVSTSANRSGQRPARTYAQCQRLFGSKVWVLPGRVGQRKRPSSIYAWGDDKIIRN